MALSLFDNIGSESAVDDGLDGSHFDVVAVHLQNTLDELGVPADPVNQVMALAAGTRDDVLNR